MPVWEPLTKRLLLLSKAYLPTEPNSPNRKALPDCPSFESIRGPHRSNRFGFLFHQIAQIVDEPAAKNMGFAAGKKESPKTLTGFGLLFLCLFGLLSAPGCTQLRLLPEEQPFSQVYNFSSGGWKVPWDTREERVKKAKDLVRKANELSRKGNEVEAVKLLEQAKVLNPEDIQIYLTTGELYSRVGNLPQSINELEKGLILDPLSIPLNIALTQTLIAQENYLSALDPNQVVLNQDSENVEALRQKLQCLFRLNRDSEAIGVGYQLLAILPNDFSTKEALCKIYLRIHKPRRSWILLQQLVSIFEPEKLPSNLRLLEFQTLLAMQRDSDAALSLQRWYHNGGSSDALWNQCYEGCPDFLKQSAQKYLARKPGQGKQDELRPLTERPLINPRTNGKKNEKLLFESNLNQSATSSAKRLPVYQPLFR